MPHEKDWFDDDIAGMDLSYSEKSGLQIFRNYTKSFENNAIRQFRDMISHEGIDLKNLERLAEILVNEDVRFLPVILCGYADNVLKDAFLVSLPPDTPGGVKDMLGGYGPLSDLSKRIRMAFAFDVISKDLALDIDRIREVRNRVSHDWDLKSADELLGHPKLSALYPIEDDLAEFEAFVAQLSAEKIFRVRLIWLAGRLTYEAAAYHRAKAARLSPYRALYEDGGTTWLNAISGICTRATQHMKS